MRTLRPIFALCALTALCWATASSAQITIIAHKSVVADEIDRAQLIDLYSGDVKKWSDKSPVVLFDLRGKNQSKEAFYRYLKKKPTRLKSIWLKRMLSGEGDPPKQMKSAAELLAQVAATEGAIGYVDYAAVTDQVKTLLIIEKDRGE
jgi:ABC-type phosphate transport system substrate-binding protein